VCMHDVDGRFDVRRLMTHQVSIVSATHQQQRSHHLLLTMRFSAAAVTACTVASTCLLCDNVLGKIFGDGGVDFVLARHLRSALMSHSPCCPCSAITVNHRIRSSCHCEPSFYSGSCYYGETSFS
jgi:hypothetical protein